MHVRLSLPLRSLRRCLIRLFMLNTCWMCDITIILLISIHSVVVTLIYLSSVIVVITLIFIVIMMFVVRRSNIFFIVLVIGFLLPDMSLIPSYSLLIELFRNISISFMLNVLHLTWSFIVFRNYCLIIWISLMLIYWNSSFI